MQQCVREERVLLSVVSRARNPAAGRSSELPQAHKERWERCGTIQSRRGGDQRVMAGADQTRSNIGYCEFCCALGEKT